jgi:hypothetical protein
MSTRDWPMPDADGRRLRPGLRYGDGRLVSELWHNDVGSPFWILRCPIVGRAKRLREDDPDQLRLVP